MTPPRTLGIVLLVVGVLLLFFGLRATDSVGESITEGVTGSYTNRTLWLIVGGAVAVIAGGALAFVGGRHRLA
jgi:uncharacterized membrane protein